MPKVTPPSIASNLATKAAAAGATRIGIAAALQDIENQRREGKTDAHEALKTVFDTVERQRKAG